MTNETTQTREGRIIVSHMDKKIIFTTPSLGPGMYEDHKQKLIQKGLRLPNGNELASLLYEVFCEPQLLEKSEECRQEFNYFHNTYKIFTNNIWTPQGLYVIPETKSTGEIRFAPRESFIIGKQSPEDLARNGIIIANFGKEGAKKLAKVSRKLMDTTKFSPPILPYVGGFLVDKEQESLAKIPHISFTGNPYYSKYTNKDCLGDKYGNLRMGPCCQYETGEGHGPQAIGIIP